MPLVSQNNVYKLKKDKIFPKNLVNLMRKKYLIIRSSKGLEIEEKFIVKSELIR